MKPFLVHKKRKFIQNVLVLFLFSIIVLTFFWKVYMLYTTCIRTYITTNRMKHKSISLFINAPKPEEIKKLRETVNIMSMQKRKFIKKQVQAYLLIDWFSFLTSLFQHTNYLKQASLSKKLIKMTIETQNETMLETILQRLKQYPPFKQIQTRSCEKTTAQTFLCEISIVPILQTFS